MLELTWQICVYEAHDLMRQYTTPSLTLLCRTTYLGISVRGFCDGDAEDDGDAEGSITA